MINAANLEGSTSKRSRAASFERRPNYLNINDTMLTIPLHAELAEIIAATPNEHLTFLTTGFESRSPHRRELVPRALQ
jgi:hypothetical protein